MWDKLNLEMSQVVTPIIRTWTNWKWTHGTRLTWTNHGAVRGLK